MLFVAELVVLTVWLDGGSLNRQTAITYWMWRWGAAILRSAVAYGAIITLGCLSRRRALAQFAEEAFERPIAGPYLAAHVLAMACFAALAPQLYGGSARGTTAETIAVAWMAAGLAAIVLAATAFVPPAVWLRLFRATGRVWIYALFGAAVAGCCGVAMRVLWMPAARLTFRMVALGLSPILAHFYSDPARLSLGTPAFDVRIEPECSGLEGMGLVLIFGAVWLCLFRRDLRFPHALVFLPIGLIAAFLLNAVRIAVLILIGNAGAPGLALGGFHSQAGWIAFNLVALGMVMGAQRLPGLARSGIPRGGSVDPATTAYLLPFLAILAAATITRTVSAGFEWLYPLRFFAAAAVLWFCRKQYRILDWRLSWYGAGAGVIVFLLWIGVDRLLGPGAPGAAAGPIHAGGPAWIGWLSLRTLATVVTVPIAEELAFRGYLMRRIATPNFERLDFRDVTPVAVLLSSLAFGLMHGPRWLAGTGAGLVYAWSARRGGRFGESVAAHAITNALLAAWVIWHGDWHLW